MSIVYIDKYNREVKPGDYILFIMDTLGIQHGMCTGQVAKISDINFLEFPAYYSDKFDFVVNTLKERYTSSTVYKILCYKLEKVDSEILDKFNNGYLSKYLLSDDYEDDSNKLYDILGRDLYIGDFVCFTKSNSDINTLDYGIVIDEKHIFTSKGVKKRAKAVFKLKSLIDKEKEIYYNIKSEYKKYQNTKIINNSFIKQITPGDIFRSNNSLYLYVGRYIFHATVVPNNNINSYLMSKLGFSPNVNEINNTLVDLYLKIDYSTKKGKLLYENLKNNTATQEDITNFILSSSSPMYDTAKITVFNAYKFNLSVKKLGFYFDHIDFNFNCGVTYSCYYADFIYFFDIK